MRSLPFIATLLVGLASTVVSTAAGAGTGEPIPAGPVTLNADVTVDGAVLHLGDLFAGVGDAAAVPVAKAPEPGRQLRLDARWLGRLARSHNLAWQPRSAFATATVERASQRISTGEVEAVVADSLAVRGLDGDFDVILDDPDLKLFAAAGPAPRLSLEGLAYNPRSERWSGTLLARVDGAETMRASLRGRAFRIIEVPVLRHRLGADTVIGDGDIDWLRLPAAKLGRSVVTEAADMIGKSPRRALRAGRPVRLGELRAPVLVARNSLVTIHLQSRWMRLTVQGRALEDGAIGQVIRVKNTKSNAVLHAEVAGPSVVAVPLPVSFAFDQGGSR